MGFIFLQYQFTRPMVRFIILIAFYLAFSATYQVAYCTLSANELFVQLMEMERTYLQLRLDRIEAYFNSHALGGSIIPSDQSPPLGESSLSERASLVSPPAQVEPPAQVDPPSPTGSTRSTGSTGENDSGRVFQQSLDNFNADLLRQMDEETALVQQSISNAGVQSADSTVVTGPGAHVTIYGRRDQDGEFSAEMFQSRADMKTSFSDGNFLQRIVRSLFTVETKAPPAGNLTVDMKVKMGDGSYKSVVSQNMNFLVDENDSVDTRSNPPSPERTSTPSPERTSSSSPERTSSSYSRTCDSPREVTLRTGLRESSPPSTREASPPSGREVFTQTLRTCDSPREVTFRTALRVSPPPKDSETLEDAVRGFYQK